MRNAGAAKVFLAAIGAFVLAGSGASATSRGGVVFVRYVGSHYELFKIRPDGTGLVRLTHNNADDEAPRWSPDGRRLLALSDGSLVVRAANGRLLRRVRAAGFNVRWATWSPDGRLIAYLLGRCPDPSGKGDDACADLWVIHPDGTGRRRVAAEDVDLTVVGRPYAWAPDGGRLVYPKFGGGGLVVVRVRDGRKRILRTHRRLSSDPSWSPDGRWIAFSRQRRAFSGSDLYVIAPDGTKLHRIARGAHVSGATWSPDGRRIAYLRLRSFGGYEHWAVVIAARDGSRPRRLAVATDDPMLLWSPDSSRIIWTTSAYRLMVARADGRGLLRLLTTGETPDWG